MKYIGIDYGSKRIGIAVGNTDENIAFPKEVVENTKEAVAYISDYIKKEGIAGIVVGESKNLDGNENPIMKDIKAFVVSIEKATGIKTVFEPEFFSSAEAEREQGKNKMIDASAASIILGSFLNKQKHNKNKKEMEKITIDDFAKVEIKAGRIISAEGIEGSEKLLKLSVDFGEENTRQVLSGIAKYFPNGEGLAGKLCAFVTNLPPREMMGMESQAMIMGFSTDDNFSLLNISETIPTGTKAK